ncbi:MAG: hypothetical protein MJ071_03645 [Oscillospiraceae bacterium]|nr:hypothetical protein [Oscillospiraceae bacterium]
MSKNAWSGKVIFCRRVKGNAIAFYMNDGADCHYLFSTEYYSKEELFKEYKNGKAYDDILQKSQKSKLASVTRKKRKAKLRWEDFQRQKLKERIVRMVRYVEMETAMEQDGSAA